VVWRTARLLPEELVFKVSYLGGEMPTLALNFSRPGGEIVAQYYLLLRLGREGYRKVQQACMDTARILAGEIAEMGPFTLVYDGHGGLPAISYTLKDPDPGVSRCMTCRSSCGCAAGRCPPTRCRPPARRP
jgi:glutamate decarboxylase